MRVERGQRQFPGGNQVVGGAGPHRRRPQREPAGVAKHLHRHAVAVLVGVPDILAGLGAGGDPVGGDEGPFKHKGLPAGAGWSSTSGQFGGLRGGHVERLTEVPIGGGDAQLRVGG